MADSPVVVGPFSTDSVEVGVTDAQATTVNQRGYLSVGFDGSNYRFVRINTSGQQIMVGSGTAGTPSGGVVSVQGVTGGQALPISAAALPLPSGAATEATLSAIDTTLDVALSTRASEATLASIDGNIDVALSTVATEATLATLLTESTFTTRVPVLVTGGGAEATALRVTIANDSTGVLSIDDNGGSITVDTTQLPAALVGGRLDTNLGAWLGSTAPTVGQKAMASSVPIVIASDQSAIPVSQSGTWTVQQGTPPWAIQTEVQLDYDTGVGTENLSLVGLALPASGGAVAGGTATDPLRVDPTGTTTQPVSAASWPLPTGAATEATLSSIDTTLDVNLSTRASEATLSSIDGNVDVALSTRASEATLATLLTESTFTTRIPVLALGGGVEASALRVTIANDSTGVLSVDDNGGSLTVDTPQLPGALVGGRLDANIGAWMGATTPTVGQKAMAASIPVVIASDQTPVDVAQSGTWTVQQGTPPWTVAGTDADGAAPTENPVLMAGQDGANVQSLKTDTTGRPEVVGAAANGVAVSGAPVRMGGSDGTLTRDILTDSGGRQVAVGAAADGATPVGNPVLTGGYDGTNVRRIRTDTGGRPVATLHDGTNGPVAVKPASTAPLSTDPALVVVLSPNQGAIPVSTSPATATAGLVFGSVALGGGTSGSQNAIRATTYNEQTTGAQRSVSSSNANDTSAGTGARTILLTYYTSAGVGPLTETVTLNGTTAVNTVATDICFIESMRVLTAGSVGTNVGVITLFVATAGGGGTLGSIGVGTIVSGSGDGRTLWAHHYIPTATICNITGIAVGASQPATFHLKSRALAVANASEVIISGLTTTTAAFQRAYGSPVTVTGPARLLAYGVPSTNGVTLNCSIDFFETA